ncbi:MAG: peptide chain release factor N(5)-glutamine methyltransferase [Magnetococcales bacterium]|nr:peptide chain release factor N(5)-glutamine methyltransferase [Magnetococcales bacterium]
MEPERWTIRKLLQWCGPWLAKQGVESPRLDGELLLAHALKLRRLDLFLDPERPLSGEELTGFKALIRRRAMREPTAYLLGRKGFWTLELEVGPGVLIPRPETERLVETALRRAPEKEAAYRVVEIGVGSGAVLFSLLQERPQATGLGVDLSPEALAWAGRNAARLGLAERTTLLEGDLFAPLGEEALPAFDAVVSNPPYVARGEWAELAPEIARWEPALALEGGEDGLDCYRRLIPQAWRWLKPGGALSLEIGAGQGDAVMGRMTAAGFRDVTLDRDYAGLPRVVSGAR